MQTINVLRLLLALAANSCAHNIWSILLVNNTESKDWQYVRDVGIEAGRNPYPGIPNMYKTYPQHTADVLTSDIRCGRDAWKPSPKTETADIVAGSEVGFRVGKVYPDEDSNVRRVYHLGPAFIYLAKKPDGINITEWDGDGDFFKIDYKGPINDTRWFITGKLDYNFTIPEATPPGQYLMRVEYFWPRMRNESQFYVNCAQVNILGSGGESPTDFARFPGVYEPGSPSITVPDGEEYYPSDGLGSDYRWHGGFMEYVPPGPPVWTG